MAGPLFTDGATESGLDLASGEKEESSPQLERGKTTSSATDPEKAIGRESEMAKGDFADAQQDVSWDGEEDPNNPLNWPARRRLVMTAIISLGGLVSLMSTSMIAPALGVIGDNLYMGPSETNLTLSIYVLGLAFGPLFISPLSEMFGRKPVYLFCHVWYLLWNALCPVGKMRGLLIVGRFFSGLGSSVGLALPGPITADMWRSEKRGFSYGFITFAPLLGAAIGPIVGGFITDSLGWPWVFWIISIWDVILVILGAFFIHESYAPILLAKKAQKMRKSQGGHHVVDSVRKKDTLTAKLQITMVRPLWMLFTQPIVPVMSLFLAYNFGVYIIALSTFAAMWISEYSESPAISGLNYIAIATGSTVASQLGGLATDKVYEYLKTKAGGEVTPEYRVPLMLPGTFLMPVGLFWYGWSVEKHIVWLMPDIGVGIFACGSILSQQATIIYIVEAFDKHSASAVAAVRVLSNIFGFAFPLFAAQLYVALGYGWGNSLLAFLFLAMGVPTPLLLWKYGARIRKAGKNRGETSK